MKYELFIERSAQKALSKISLPDRDRIIDAIRKLAADPRPQGVKKLTGRAAWRIRVGNYRVIYEIHDDRLLIVVVCVGHRQDVYR